MPQGLDWKKEEMLWDKRRLPRAPLPRERFSSMWYLLTSSKCAADINFIHLCTLRKRDKYYVPQQ